MRLEARSYGPHELVVACVIDDVGDPATVRERLRDARPQNGVSKLLANLRRKESRPRIAILDEDQIRRQLNLPAHASGETVEETIRAGVNLGPDQLKIFLLSKNIESVIAALRDCGHQSTQFEAALRKDLLARDSVLIGAARAPARFVRDCTRRKIPSLDEIVRDLAKVVSV